MTETIEQNIQEVRTKLEKQKPLPEIIQSANKRLEESDERVLRNQRHVAKADQSLQDALDHRVQCQKNVRS